MIVQIIADSFVGLYGIGLLTGIVVVIRIAYDEAIKRIMTQATNNRH